MFYAWSADGKKLLGAIDSGDAQKPTKLVWVNVADGAVQALPIAHRNLGSASVSPDGRYVAFMASKEDSQENVYIMATDGSGETLVSASPSWQEPVGWTPDGRQLLFAQSGSLWAVRIDGGKPGVPIPIQSNFGNDAVRFLGIPRNGAIYYRVVTNTSDIFTASMDPGTGKLTSTPVQLPLSRSGHNQGATLVAGRGTDSPSLGSGDVPDRYLGALGLFN